MNDELDNDLLYIALNSIIGEYMIKGVVKINVVTEEDLAYLSFIENIIGRQFQYEIPDDEYIMFKVTFVLSEKELDSLEEYHEFLQAFEVNYESLW